MDLDDLRKLEICGLCGVVYMPKFVGDGGYSNSPMALNRNRCENCSPLQKEEIAEIKKYENRYN